MDRGVWEAAVHGNTKSWAQLIDRLTEPASLGPIVFPLMARQRAKLI